MNVAADLVASLAILGFAMVILFLGFAWAMLAVESEADERARRLHQTREQDADARSIDDFDRWRAELDRGVP